MQYSSSSEDLDLPPQAPAQQSQDHDVEDNYYYDSQLPSKYQVYPQAEASAEEDKVSSSEDILPEINYDSVPIQGYTSYPQEQFRPAPKLSAFNQQEDLHAQYLFPAKYQQKADSFVEEEQQSAKLAQPRTKSQQYPSALAYYKTQYYGRDAYGNMQQFAKPPPQPLDQLSQRQPLSMSTLQEENLKRARALQEQAQQRMEQIKLLEQQDQVEKLAREQAKRLYTQLNREKERQKLRTARYKHDEMMHLLSKEQLPECTRENLQKPNFFKELHDKQFPKPYNPQLLAKDKDEKLYYGTIVHKQREAAVLQERYGIADNKHQERKRQSKIPRIPNAPKARGTLQSGMDYAAPDKFVFSPTRSGDFAQFEGEYDTVQEPQAACEDYGGDFVYNQ